jgi:hypothetical protein
MNRIIFIFFLLFTKNSCLFSQTDNVASVPDLSIDSTGLLKWTVSFSGGYCEGIAVQWRFGKWTILEQPFKYNSPSSQVKTNINDSLQVKFFSGLNRYKIMIRTPQKVSSKEVSFINKTTENDLNVWKVDNEIIQDTKTTYKILDSKNKTVLKGTVGAGKKINVSRLKPGNYTFVTPRATKQFIKN